jgi:hypothetical protein
MIKDIVVALEVGSSSDPASDYAISVATVFNAHLAAIGFAYEPILPIIDMGGAALQIIDELREENKRAATAAVARFEESGRIAGLSLESRVIETTASEATRIFGLTARSYDLSVVGQPDPKSARDDLMIQSALFDSGRPVLVVPYIQRKGLKLDRVTACWDGSHTAARAINDAIPFLTRAKKVDVVTIDTKETGTGEIKGVDIAQHLARHGADLMA